MTATPRKTSPWAARKWMAIAAGLLVVHATLMIAAVVVASSGNTFVAMPGYYQKSLAWDEEQSQRAAAKGMGLVVAIEPGELVRGGAERQVAITLKSTGSETINVTRLSVKYYHHAEAGRVLSATVASGGMVTVDRPGFWQFEVTAEVQGKHVLLEETKFVNG